MADQIEVRLNGPTLSSERSRLSLTIGSRVVEMSYRIDSVSRTFVSALPPVVHDLLDIAGTVYAADFAISRGGLSDERMGQNWRRHFNLVVPVRDPARWARNTVSGALSDCLGFLSEDFWSFEFRQAETVAPRQGLFDFSDQSNFGPTRVQMFSGGLDSLAGALEELIEREERVLLASHGSATKLAPVQRRLVDAMRQKIKADRLRHVSVKAQLANRARREGTQKTRSFLFAALGITVARGYGLNRATFFENGVVSLNLPPVAQVARDDSNFGGSGPPRRDILARIAALDSRIRAVARRHATVRLLMTAPGVGPIRAMAVVAAFDDASRFRRSSSAGA